MNNIRIKITKDCIVKRTISSSGTYDTIYNVGETFEFPSDCVSVEMPGSKATTDFGTPKDFIKAKELEAKLSNTNRRYNSLAIDRDNINKRLEKLESEKGSRLAELDKRLSALERLKLDDLIEIVDEFCQQAEKKSEAQ